MTVHHLEKGYSTVSFSGRNTVVSQFVGDKSEHLFPSHAIVTLSHPFAVIALSNIVSQAVDHVERNKLQIRSV
jgi:hypothetical protein